MVVRARGLALATALVVSACATPAPSLEAARGEVFAAERAFARSMADRDLAAFGRYVADDTVFFSGKRVLRGKAEVIEGWKAFFEGSSAPFSWEPDQVEVLGSGQLALSTGPVRNPRGEVIARFNSIWQRHSDGSWRVIFDKGSPPDPTEK